jgi:FAD/FMN-containing dehydrogenase
MRARKSWKGQDRSGDRIPVGDPRYAAMVRGFNLRWAASPRYVALCHDAAEVARAVQKALDAGLRLTVRSGGHCYEDFFACNDGGVLLDLSPMTAVSRDPATGWYSVEAGATLWAVYDWLYRAHGVSLPGGSCYSVAAGGHVVGGGYGLLSRRDGLTVDYLHAVELVHVTSDRRARVITLRRDARDPAERESFWGHLGGGGGNFGIVTRLWFKALPAAPKDAYLLDLSWDWKGLQKADFARIVRVYGEFFAANSGVDSPYKDLDAGLGLTHKSAGQIGLSAQYVGEEPERLTALARLLAQTLPAPVAREVHIAHCRPPARTIEIRKMPWLFAAQTSNESGPNRRSKHKSAYMIKPFPDGQVDVLWDFLTTDRTTDPTAVLSVNGYGGQVNAVDPAATAVPQRSSILKLQYHTYWLDPADDAAHLRWIREFYTAMYGERGPVPDGTVDGCYVNYADADLEGWQSLYYKDNYPRLRRVKARLDPLDILHHRQSIELPDGAR